MSVLKILVSSVHIIFSVFIIVAILLQSGKAQGLSGAIAGGAETFFGKNKGRTLDAMLGKVTSFIAIGFLVSSVALYVLLSNPEPAKPSATTAPVLTTPAVAKPATTKGADKQPATTKAATDAAATKATTTAPVATTAATTAPAATTTQPVATPKG